MGTEPGTFRSLSTTQVEHGKIQLMPHQWTGTLTSDGDLTDWLLPDEAALLTRSQAAAIRELIVDFSTERGSVETTITYPTPPPGVQALMVPRTTWHLRLNPPSKVELETFVQLGALLLLGTKGDLKTLSIAAIATLRDRLSRLSVQYGELSVAEIILRLGRGTAAEVTAELNGRECPHQGAACRFLSNGYCTAVEDQVQAIANSLVDRQILSRCNAFEPYEYTVAL